MSQKNLRTCEKGHTYYKSTDCSTCPICEAQRKPKTGFLSLLSAPARRALENVGITTLEELSKHSETAILKLHGIGKTAIPKLREALLSENLTFAKPMK
jgi:predicted RecB family nuclease